MISKSVSLPHANILAQIHNQTPGISPSDRDSTLHLTDDPNISHAIYSTCLRVFLTRLWRLLAQYLYSLQEPVYLFFR